MKRLEKIKRTLFVVGLTAYCVIAFTSCCKDECELKYSTYSYSLTQSILVDGVNYNGYMRYDNVSAYLLDSYFVEGDTLKWNFKMYNPLKETITLKEVNVYIANKKIASAKNVLECPIVYPIKNMPVGEYDYSIEYKFEPEGTGDCDDENRILAGKIYVLEEKPNVVYTADFPTEIKNNEEFEVTTNLTSNIDFISLYRVDFFWDNEVIEQVKEEPFSLKYMLHVQQPGKHRLGVRWYFRNEKTQGTLSDQRDYEVYIVE